LADGHRLVHDDTKRNAAKAPAKEHVHLKPRPGPEEQARQNERARQIERLRSHPVFMAKLRELAAEENAKWRVLRSRWLWWPRQVLAVSVGHEHHLRIDL
jgi:hypothetical protein